MYTHKCLLKLLFLSFCLVLLSSDLAVADSKAILCSEYQARAPELNPGVDSPTVKLASPEQQHPCWVDLCPSDNDKIEPGECGCGVPETNSDSDHVPDCNDLCPDHGSFWDVRCKVCQETSYQPSNIPLCHHPDEFPTFRQTKTLPAVVAQSDNCPEDTKVTNLPPCCGETAFRDPTNIPNCYRQGEDNFYLQTRFLRANRPDNCPTETRQVIIPTVCPEDCEVGEWTPPDSDKPDCGNGPFVQTRQITQNKVGAGADCPSLRKETPLDVCEVEPNSVVNDCREVHMGAHAHITGGREPQHYVSSSVLTYCGVPGFCISICRNDGGGCWPDCSYDAYAPTVNASWANRWTTGPWSDCDGDCGGGEGKRTRSVTCYSGVFGGTNLADEYCQFAGTKPPTEEVCTNTRSCGAKCPDYRGVPNVSTTTCRGQIDSERCNACSCQGAWGLPGGGSNLRAGWGESGGCAWDSACKTYECNL